MASSLDGRGSSPTLTPPEIRAQIGHPIIDFDGHVIEFLPGFFEVLADVAGPGTVDRLRPRSGPRGVPGQQRNDTWYDLTAAERRNRAMERPSFWNFPTAIALDRATATIPGLLYHRLEELGFDFALLYPSAGLSFPHIDDEELRIAACRALNKLHAEVFAPFRDRLEPVAVIPMHTPTEAVAELHHAVEELGLKTALIPSYVRRPVRHLVDRLPEAAPLAARLDTFGIDSDHDYDVVWQAGMRLNAVLGSDIGHWDVPDFSEVLGEVVEAVEQGTMTDDDLTAFTYHNAVRFLTGGNPSFFDGTALEAQARQLLAASRRR